MFVLLCSTRTYSLISKQEQSRSIGIELIKKGNNEKDGNEIEKSQTVYEKVRNETNFMSFYKRGSQKG